MTVVAFSQRPAVSSFALLSILAGVPFDYLWQMSGRRKPAGERPVE
jgi:hypothetical protein